MDNFLLIHNLWITLAWSLVVDCLLFCSLLWYNYHMKTLLNKLFFILISSIAFIAIASFSTPYILLFLPWFLMTGLDKKLED